MGGIFGNGFFDRSMENELFIHLDNEQRVYCDYCEESFDIDDCDIMSEELIICPKCENVIEL